MKRTPKELDRMSLVTVAGLAGKHRARGSQFHHQESAAIIVDQVFEAARADKPVQRSSRRLLNIPGALEVA